MVLLTAHWTIAQDVTFTEKKDEITDEVIITSNMINLTPMFIDNTYSHSGVMMSALDMARMLTVQVAYQGDPIMCINDNATLYLKTTKGEVFKLENINNSEASAVAYTGTWINRFSFALTSANMDFLRNNEFTVLRVETSRKTVTSKIKPNRQGAISKLISVYQKIYKI